MRVGESFRCWLTSRLTQAQAGPALPLGTSTLIGMDNLHKNDNENTGTTFTDSCSSSRISPECFLPGLVV
ncbi:3-isopropylmalate dehydrogenase [Fusarium oxysporum f. sp. albedinis]|nr:3-isopropylmalate dehydrogenase [Fusarium oxysporum f. sp. albedinis]